MIFGADKIPDIAKGMAKGIKKVKDATQEIKTEIKKSAEKKGIDTDSISKEIDKVKDDMIFRVLPENIFKNFKNIPFDKAIMEKLKMQSLYR